MQSKWGLCDEMKNHYTKENGYKACSDDAFDHSI